MNVPGPAVVGSVTVVPPPDVVVGGAAIAVTVGGFAAVVNLTVASST